MSNHIQEAKTTLKAAVPGPSWVVDEILKPIIERLETAEEQVKQLKEARPIDEWHEDIGAVLWWEFPISEPPYCGSPLDSEWPGYHTHWTPIVTPESATLHSKEEEAK